MNGIKENHPPEIQFKSHPANGNVHILPASKGMIGTCAMSMYSLQHLYTNNLKQNAVNVNEKTTIFLAQAAALTAKKEKRKKGEVRRQKWWKGGKDDRNKEKVPTLPPTHITPGTVILQKQSPNY
jgi:hypothetical protein